MKRTIVTALLGLGFAMTASAQDMMSHVDLSSPDMVTAEMSRADVETALGMATIARARRFHRKEIVWPRPLRAQPFQRGISCGTAQQDEARRREARWCGSRSGMADPRRT